MFSQRRFALSVVCWGYTHFFAMPRPVTRTLAKMRADVQSAQSQLAAAEERAKTREAASAPGPKKSMAGPSRGHPAKREPVIAVGPLDDADFSDSVEFPLLRIGPVAMSGSNAFQGRLRRVSMGRNRGMFLPPRPRQLSYSQRTSIKGRVKLWYVYAEARPRRSLIAWAATGSGSTTAPGRQLPLSRS